MWDSGKGVLSGKFIALNLKWVSPRIYKIIFKEKNKVGGISVPHTKAYYMVAIIRTVWYWWKNRHMDQWHDWRSQLDMRPTEIHLTDSLERCKSNPKKERAFNKWCWSNWTSMQGQTYLNLNLTPHIRIY